MKTLIAIAVGLVLSFHTNVFAHEGHDHDAPKGIEAPQGGTIMSIDNTYIESRYENKKISVYVYDKELKPKKTEGFKVTFKVQQPKKEEKELVAHKDLGTHWEADFDAKNWHRLILHVDINDPADKKDEKISMSVDTKK